MKTVRHIIEAKIAQIAPQGDTFSVQWYLNSILGFLEEDGLADCFVDEEIHIPYDEYRISSGTYPYVSSPEKIREIELAFRHSDDYKELKRLLTPAPEAMDSVAPSINYHFLLKASIACAALSLGCLISTLAVAIFATSAVGVILLATPAVASAVASYGLFKAYRMHQHQAVPPAGHDMAYQ